MALTDVTGTDAPTTMPPPPIAPPVSIDQQGAQDWTSQYGMTPPPQAVVDRVAYLDQLKQAWQDEMQKRAAALNILNAAQTAFNTSMQLGTQPSTAGYEGMSTNPLTQADNPQVPVFQQQPGAVWPRYPDNPAQELANIGELAGKTLGADIPGMQKVADFVGQGAGAIAPGLAKLTPGIGPLANIASLIPGGKSDAAISKTAQVGAESLVPTQVWQAALTLIPAAKARTIPELLSAITLGDTDAITAIRNAGKSLGESPKVESLLAKLGSELGQSKIPGEAVGEVAPAVIPKLDTLSRGEQLRLALGAKTQDVLKVAERYDRGSPQRAQLAAWVDAQTQHLPDSTRKAIGIFIDTLPTKAERKLATQAQRIRQASAAAAGFRGEGTTVERAVASLKAMGGKQAQRFTPVGDRFTPQEVTDLYAQIDAAFHAGKFDSPMQAANATSALNLLLTGERLPGVVSETAKPLNLMPHEIDLLGRVFGNEFASYVPRTAEHMAGLERIFDVLNLPRALVTAADFSAAGRQGILLTARNPVEVAKSFPQMIRAMASEEGFARAAANLRANSMYEDALAHGLYLADIGGGAGAEEAYVSRIASHIPLVRGSERGFVMYLDTLRMLNYEKTANRFERLAVKNNWSVERLNLVKTEVARFLNHASGRGDVGTVAGNLTPALNAAFFAPRFLVSRPQSIWDMVRPGATIQSRQIAFENLGAFVGAGTAALLAAKQLGADVELDPRSSDFGKMKFGNMRIEFWGGYQPLARYVAQIATASTKPLAGGKPTYAYPGSTLLRFIRSKLSPAGAMLYDYTEGKGKGYSGENLLLNPRDIGLNQTTGQFAKNVFLDKITPLAIQDAIDGYNQTGPWGGAIAGLVSAAGGGVGAFSESAQAQKTATRSIGTEALKQTGVPMTNGNVDFAQPQLDGNPTGKKTQRQAIADILKIDVPDDASLSDMRKAYIDQKAKDYAKARNISDAVARHELGLAFDALPAIKQITDNADVAELNWWKAHPQMLKQAIDAGVTSISQEKLRILRDSGIR